MCNIIFLLLYLTLSVSAWAQNTKPNIVFIFIDDMGWSDLSCFGNTDTKTESIDKLAAEGIRFEQFYVNSPICSPSRVAVSTGQYPQRWRITSYLSNRNLNRGRGIANWLNPQAPILARSLKQAGYMTGHFGKWHMGGQRDVDEAPPITQYGFDESLTNFEGLGPKLLPLIRTPMALEFKKIWADAVRLGKGPVTWVDRSKITGEFTKAAINFIKKSKTANKPFYINLWPDDVHSPFYPSLKGWKDGSGKRNLYLSVLKEMDLQLDQLFSYIKADRKLRNNTLILICSDNGPEKGAGRGSNLKGYKTHLYEGGIRSPLIVWGPGFISQAKRGSRNNTSIFSGIDLVPSIINFARIQNDVNYDGEVLINTLTGKSVSSRKKPIFFRRPPDRKSYYGFQNLPDLSVRDGKWKLLCNYDGSNAQLYNIPNDHGENKNLASKYPAIVQKMAKGLMAWNSALPKDNGGWGEKP